MDIFFTVDDKFKQYLYATLYSILTNAKMDDKFHFHILDAGLSDKTKCEIEKFKQIKSFTIDYTPMSDEEFEDYPINPTLKSKVYYYRLKIPEKFPNINRALFLDTDIIVQSSLSDLFNTNMENKSVACVANGNLENELQNKRLGLSPEHIYFNAGILLIDCEKWRKENILNKTKQIAETKYHILKWADQDILNIIFENNYKILPPKYNFWPGMNRKGFESNLKNYKKWYAHTSYTEKDLKDAIKSPVIIHFAGGAKPERETSTDYVKVLYQKYQSQWLAIPGINEDNGITFKWDLKQLEEYIAATDTCECTQLALRLINKIRTERNIEPKVLEAGSGNGRVIIYLTRKGCKNISGIEINTKIVEKLNEEFPNLKIYAGNILQLPDNLKDNDVVLSFGVIEHFITGPQKPLKEMFDSIKPDGYAVVGVPCLNLCRNCLALFDKKTKKFMKTGDYKYHVWRLNNEFYEYHMTPKEFENECKNAGFEIISHKPIQNELGIMHLINPKNKKGKFIWYEKLEKYEFSFLGKIIYKLALLISFLCCHGQVCVLKKKGI